ncbi:low affinity immunoglobulin gamma Fc region receptor II-a-like [Archocentrus centrarchus]|uniref:low affinity immunoglobulin gamma Fc region receptor II-a-like n=1 Tax=Archocentrus centrarchus TaxID=63155 RepID=UPI0011E9C6B0|nr:low affinity immunoglobulin gamma Fc region receptor II-a-like [Archocentrus centrarchus]
MEVGALHRLYAGFHIVPDRLQLLQYESLSFHCDAPDGSAQLRGVRNTEGFLSACDMKQSSTAYCTIHRAYQADSGKYWCETEGGERSSTVNITVTAGSVILESPVFAVLEGHCVTLSCRNKSTSSQLHADFYKDGVLIGNSTTGDMMIHSVSTADEGRYKCSISDAGGSPESWLAVTGSAAFTDRSTQIYLILRTVFTVVMVALLLLLLGLLHCGKLRLS